ncbi:LacI family DNA-binding transcriptional regulator [Neobacillus sp. 3P2-tot-E-2]|uniref:LacI family DNA-binding transcriptional regulator n=1 Tax=Neobacillus sp. 3P2-tot-E-2 TaxID=3132212 RepID=UPI00399F8B77
MAGISMRELAESLGVSVASVSVALRGKSGISEETRVRILEEAKKRGYDMTKLSVSESKGIIEIIDYTYYNHKAGATKEMFTYYTQFINTATAAIEEYGYQISGPYNPKEPGFLSRPNASGAILLGAAISKEELELYRKGKKPFVVSGNSMNRMAVNTVSHDNYYGIAVALDHLISLGHEKVGYICSVGGNIGTERYHAFLSEMAIKQLVPANYLDLRKEEADSMLNVINDWLDQNKLEATAIICDNDFIAASMMRALRDHEMVPGKDVSVIGFDDQPFSALLEPPLTTVRTYEAELGAVSVEQLVYCLEHPGCKFRHVYVGTELVTRVSTCSVNHKNKVDV